MCPFGLTHPKLHPSLKPVAPARSPSRWRAPSAALLLKPGFWSWPWLFTVFNALCPIQVLFYLFCSDDSLWVSHGHRPRLRVTMAIISCAVVQPSAFDTSVKDWWCLSPSSNLLMTCWSFPLGEQPSLHSNVFRASSMEFLPFQAHLTQWHDALAAPLHFPYSVQGTCLQLTCHPSPTSSGLLEVPSTVFPWCEVHASLGGWHKL